MQYSFKNTKLKTLPADIFVLEALDSFHSLLSSQLTTDWILECNGVSTFHPLSYARLNFFYCGETAQNSATNRRHILILTECK